MGDEEYLDVLQRQFAGGARHARNADIAFYLAGVDVAAGDRYGKLALTEEGIRRRDRCVIEVRTRPRRAFDDRVGGRLRTFASADRRPACACVSRSGGVRAGVREPGALSLF